MAFCEARFKIYAFLEKAPTFEMRSVSSNIALSQGLGLFPKALKFENGLQNMFWNGLKFDMQMAVLASGTKNI